MATSEKSAGSRREKQSPDRPRPPEVYAIVIECQDEPQQREMFERLKEWGVKVKLLVL